MKQKNIFRNLLNALMLVLFNNLTIPLHAQNVLYVKNNAKGNNSGISWADAYTSLQSALDAASNGNQIWVAAGIYYPTEDSNDRQATFQIINDVAVYGGFNGSETLLEDRNWRNNNTILSGDINHDNDLNGNSYSVVTGSGTISTAILDGFTITGGNADHDQSQTEIPNDRAGGGIFNYKDGSPTLRNLIVSGNYAFFDGGGILNYDNCSPVISNVVFANNKSTSYGGGMNNYGNSSPLLTNVIFRNNSSASGGGMACRNLSNPILVNVVFYNDSAYQGGGIYNDNSKPKLINVTITRNSASTDGGGGIYNFLDAFPDLVNVIIWDNKGGEIINKFAKAKIHYSLIAGGCPSDVNCDTNTIIDEDPKFENGEAGNFHLIKGSPAIDKGDPNTDISLFPGGPVSPTDADGNIRISDSNIDIGAYEFTGITNVETINAHLKKFVLEQNFPNPFNPETKIQFTLPQSSFVTLQVFNFLGESVSILVSKKLNAGFYEYDWDASNSTSGIYYYQLKAGNSSQSKKMILIK